MKRIKLILASVLVRLSQIERKIEMFYMDEQVDESYIIKLRTRLIRFVSISNIKRYKNEKYEELRQFPISTKEIYKSFGEHNLKSRFYKLMSFYNMNTGGSTGEPYEFIVSSKAGIVDSLHQKYQHKKIGFEDGDRIVVFNGCIIDGLDVSKNIFWKKKSQKELPFGSVEFSTHYLNPETFIFYYHQLENIKPAIIRSYPSAFLEFTKMLMLNKIQCGFNLKGIQLTSEVVSEKEIEELESYWGDIVYHQYGHSEASVIASRYPGEDCYTFSPYYGDVEILDEQDRAVAVGEVGRIVVTSWHNYARPFIRYDTGDLARLKSIKGSKVKVSEIIGRSQDYLMDKFGYKVSVAGLVFGQHFEAFSKIIKWQFVDNGNGNILIKVVPFEKLLSVDKHEIINRVNINENFNITLVEVDDLVKTKRGKHQLVIKGKHSE